MIGIIGLGKLGLPLAVTIAKHTKVRGIDLNSELIESLKNGEIPYNEPKLEDYLDYAYKNKSLKVSNNFEGLDHCSIIMCIVPTPSKKNGKFSNKYIESAIKNSIPYLKKTDLFVIVSTVMPGSCDKFKEMLPCDICYNPEFIQLGNVIYGIEKADYVLIGYDNKKALNKLTNLYKKIAPGVPVKSMDFKSAELTKIAQNSYITQKISFANSTWHSAEYYGADIDKILDAIGQDRRIGHSFLKAGAPFGGPCFPRDNRAFDGIFSKLTDRCNDTHLLWIYQKIVYMLSKKIAGKNISIYGMGYSNNSDLRIESPGVKLKELLTEFGANVLEDNIEDADLIVFMLPKKSGDRRLIKIAKRNGIKVFDVWRDK